MIRKKTGSNKLNAVMIGDRLDNDIIPVKRAGLKTVWMRQGFGGMAIPLTEEETPDCSVNDLRELLELPIRQLLR